jgi:hypothetical protein
MKEKENGVMMGAERANAERTKELLVAELNIVDADAKVPEESGVTALVQLQGYRRAYVNAYCAYLRKSMKKASSAQFGFGLRLSPNEEGALEKMRGFIGKLDEAIGMLKESES